ncbi:MAG TPA: hypothetical protein ENJ82_08640, partial [Bacteroidetes bacterium]|nr:hypothetical protein [Bacteroidota bacterium]
MRKVLLLLLICLIQFNNINAQNSSDFFKSIPVITKNTPNWAKLMYSANPNVGEVEDLFRSYFKTHEFEKTIHTQNHKHWIQQVEPLLDNNGFIILPGRAEEDAITQKLKQKYALRNRVGNGMRIPGSQVEWVSMGPFETFKQNSSQAISWHKNIYAIDQSLSNPNILICGTEAGGVYKSIDKGANWTLISKGEVFSGGNAAVKIHPTNSNNYLLASNRRIYQSTDGGLTWIDRFFTNGTGNEFKFSPSNSNIIFHTNSKGLFKSIDGGINWAQIYTEKCWDIDFHPTDTLIAYLLKTNVAAKRSELFRSNDGGNTWTLKDTGWYVPFDLSNANDGGGKIAVSPVTPDMVYVCLIGASKANDDGWIGVYKSENKGDNWSNPSGQDGGPYAAINSSSVWNVAAYSSGYHQGFYNFDFEASATVAGKLWVATIRLTESADSGR